MRQFYIMAITEKNQLGSCTAVGQNVIKFCMTVVAYFIIVTKSSRQVWEQMTQVR